MTEVSQSAVWTDVETLLTAADHASVATWALECARRVLPVFTAVAPDDDRVPRALRHLERWLSDRASDPEGRHLAIVGAHGAARALPDRSGARAAARAAAQAAATTQNPEHAIGVAMYACMAVRDAAVPGGEADVAGAARERVWQRDRLAELSGSTR